jgi:hypothetical protein
VVTLYGASAGFALLSMVLLQPDYRLAAGLLSLAGVVVWLAVQRLRIPELLEVGRIVRRSMHQRVVIGNNVRIREAMVRLRQARDGRAVADALRSAFQLGEFARVELRVNTTLGASLLSARVAGLENDWVLWQWDSDDGGASAGSGWEIRLPFRVANGVHAGGLALFYSSDTTHVLTDLRLIAQELEPVILQSLWRIHARESHAAVPELQQAMAAGA